jgi:hypothetical protein
MTEGRIGLGTEMEIHKKAFQVPRVEKGQMPD